MPHPKPAPGQRVIPYVGKAGLWNDIIDMLAWWQAQRAANTIPRGFGKCALLGKNSTGSDFLAGELAYVDSVTQPSADTPSIEVMKWGPILDLITPVWHTKIDKVVIAHKGIIDGRVEYVMTPQYIPVKGTINKAADRYAMIDPASPRKLITSDAGIFGLVGTLQFGSDSYLILDTTQSQRLWRYEINGSWASSACSIKLRRIDGDVYAATATLDDPQLIVQDQTVGDTGYCMQCGNKFLAIQAPCVG